MGLEAKLERLERMNPAISHLLTDIMLHGEFDEFKSELEQFSDEEWMLTYLISLGIAKVCEEQKIKPCSFMGGLAVYGEIFKHLGTRPFKWRGSYDIDLIAETDVIPLLRKNFAEVSKIEDFKGGIVRWIIRPDKFTIYDDVSYEPIAAEIPLDLWQPGQTPFYFTEQIDESFGTPFKKQR